MINFILKNLSPDGRVVTSVIAAVFVSWVLWASGSITTVSAGQARLAAQQEALRENTNLKLDRMNDKLDYLIKQHDAFAAKGIK
jgi:hypothetical protein